VHGQVDSLDYLGAIIVDLMLLVTFHLVTTEHARNGRSPKQVTFEIVSLALSPPGLYGRHNGLTHVISKQYR
jgi:hypothetical protein